MKKCDINVCHAACCYNVPMPKGYFSAHRKKVVNTPLRFDDAGEEPALGGKMVLPITNEDLELNKCPFLRSDCKCNIYAVRPLICRKFGTDAHESKFLNCEYLSGKKVDINTHDLFNLLSVFDVKV